MHSPSHQQYERQHTNDLASRSRDDYERRSSSRKLSSSSPNAASAGDASGHHLRRETSSASSTSRDRERDREERRHHAIPEGEVSQYHHDRESRGNRREHHHHRHHHSRSPEEAPSPSHSSTSHHRRRQSVEDVPTPLSSRSAQREGSSASALSSSSSYLSYPDSALTSVETASMRSGTSALLSTDSTVVAGLQSSRSRTPKAGGAVSPTRSDWEDAPQSREGREGKERPSAGGGTAGGGGKAIGEAKIEKGDDCLYISRDKSLIVAKCTKVDYTISPPGYEIYILNRDAYVETERHRLLTIDEAVVYREQQARGQEEQKQAVASQLARRRERAELQEEVHTVQEEASLAAYASRTRRRSLTHRGSLPDSLERGPDLPSPASSSSSSHRHRRHPHEEEAGRDRERERAHRERERERERASEREREREHHRDHHHSRELRGHRALEGGASAESPSRHAHREHGLREAREGGHPRHLHQAERREHHSPLRSR